LIGAFGGIAVIGAEERRLGHFAWLQSKRLDRLQSGIVLPTARTLYLVAAVFCVAAIVLALVVAFFFQLATWQGAGERPVPEVAAPTQVAPTLDRVEQRLSGPSAVRFVVDRAGGEGPLAAGDMIGHFEADSANGLANHPDDFQLVGGRDSELFEPVYNGRSGHTGLAATKPLADAVAAPNASADRSYSVRVVARDASGNRSDPVDIGFSFEGPSRPVPAAAGEAPVTELGGSGSLPKIARAVALRVAAPGTPEFFDAYKFALAEPSRCDAPPEGAFIDLYRASFIRFRNRVNKDTLASFSTGVCEAWADSVGQTRRAATEAESRRMAVVAANAEARMQAQVRAAGARLVRNAALAFAFSALLAFMMIALFLAFMAIEGHSAAVRQAIELLATQKEIADGPSQTG
jgi:hypothetical protein